ncbi:hypothetical protein BJX64DRAFT_298830 [Aspergillus heterothallicus]
MLAKGLIILLGGLAQLTLSIPFGEAETNPIPELDIAAPSLESRDQGVWLDAYHSGSCDSGWESQPTSGWLWSGQCKNLETFTYGARLGDNHLGWSWCKLNFWEQADCHGHATVTNIIDTEIRKLGGFYGKYKCIATANKGGQFYLANGAASVQLIC